MSKYLVSMGLLLGSLTGVASAAPAHGLPLSTQQAQVSAMAGGVYRVGDPVWILWNGNWYPGEILAVYNGRGTYKVHYDGYGSEWDEEVGPDRLSPQ